MADSSPVFGLRNIIQDQKEVCKALGEPYVLLFLACAVEVEETVWAWGHRGVEGGSPLPPSLQHTKLKKINKSRVLHGNRVSMWVSQPMGDYYIQTPGSPQIIIQQQQGSWGREKAP